MGRKKIIEREFALLLNQHRFWGTIITPYIITKEEGAQYFTPEECLSPYASPETTADLSEQENDIIDLINSYTDRNLFRLFSRENNVMDFLEKVDEDRFEKHIKPYIEDKLFRCLVIVVRDNIPVYRQKTKTINLHEEDKIDIISTPAQAIFHFNHDPGNSSYFLNISIDEVIIDLLGKDVEIISNSPAAIRYEDSILFVENLEGKKLMPFLKKKEVIIPGHLNEKYFSGFVLNAVNSNIVKPEGFDINFPDPKKKAILYLEYGIRNIPTLILKFRYEDIEIFHDSKENNFTRLTTTKGRYSYNKYGRNKEWENESINTLSELEFYSDDNINYSTAITGNGKSNELHSLVEAINNHNQALVEAGFEIKTGSIDNNYYLENYKLTIAYDVANDWFDLKAYIKIDDIEIPFLKLKKNILEGNREYRLSDGRILVLPEEWFAKYKSLFELGTADGEILKIHKQHFSLLNEAFNEDECKSCPKLEKLVLPEQIPEIKPPDGLNATMRAYQEEGLNWLMFLQTNNLGGCLADDMGLGKTIQTLSMLQFNKERNGEREKYQSSTQKNLFTASNENKTSLLIVPASLVYNWKKEIQKFTPGLSLCTYIGNQRKKNTEYFSEYDIILSTYHTVRQDIDHLSKYTFFYVILDESQLIKNPASQLYKTVIRLKSDHRLVLTGTPVENSLTDLWTQLNFVNPGILGNLNYFKSEFAKPIEQKSSEEKEIKLNKLIRPFILRRSKSEVATDLPPVTEQIVFCDMSEEQAKIYEEEKSAIRNTILNNIESIGVEKSAIMVLQGLMKLRQLSNHPELTDPGYRGSAGKFDTVMEDIRSVVSEGHKILLFSSFVKHLNLFAKVFNEEGIGYSMLTGSSTNREKIVTEFQENKETRLFLISLKAGGVGLNLTSADYVFILDPWWNPAAEAQALNRAHRIGQDKNVFVYRYISTGSIEEKIVKLQEKKSKLAETFISSSNPLKDLDIKEMFELIG